MTDDNQDILTAEDRELFLDIAKEICKNPTKYREAGIWLDEYCNEDAYWQRQQTKLEELQRKKNEFPVLTNIRSVEQLERKIKERQSPALYIRFKEAQNCLLKKYKNEQFAPEDDAKQIILITWLLTDPDAEKADIGITEFEKWLWEPIDDITKMSRGTAQSLWVQSRAGYELWMKLVRVAWDKLKFKKDKYCQTNTFKFVLIPIACTLIVAIPAWFALFRDGQSETTLNSSKKVEEKLKKIKEMAAPPTLTLMPGITTKNDSEHNRLLWFKPSKNEPLGRITLIVKVIGDSSAKIIEFYSDGPATLERKEISEDGKEAQLAYSLIGWYYPKAVVRTSNACKVVVSGSHITEPITVDID